MANSNENSLNAHLHNPDFNPTNICGDTRPRKFPTVSRHEALYLKSAMPTSLRCHRYPYGSFAELSEDRTRDSRRGLLNKRARYRWLTKK